MGQGSLNFNREVVDVSDETVKKCKSLKSALRMCVDVSGRCIKDVAFSLDIDEKHLARMLSDNPNDARHFPPDLIDPLMNVCGNEIPLRWLALSRGYGLHKLKSRLEEENEALQRQLEDERRKFETITEFMKTVRGAA